MSGENGNADSGASVGSDLGVSSSPAPSDGDIDFSGMDSALDGDFGELGAGSEVGESPAPTQTKTEPSSPPAPAPLEGEAAKPEAQPTEAPKPVPQQPKADAASPSQQNGQPATEAKTPPGEAAQSELDSFLSDVTQNEAQFVDHLATTQFKLSPEMVQALADGQGETMIPKIVAGGALWAVKSMTNIFKQTIPKIIEKEVSRITQEQNLRKDSEDKFFAKWPQLSRDKHFADVQQISRAFFAQNPKMSFDDLVLKTGAAVMAMHGLVGAPATTQASKPANGFVPAAPVARVVSQVPVDQNPFGGLAQDYDD